MSEDDDSIKSLLDCVQTAIVATDLAGNFIYYNAAAEQLLGLGPTPLPPQAWPEAYGTFESDGVTPIPLEQLPVWHALHGEAAQADMMIRNQAYPDGRHIAAHAQPWLDPAGKHRGAVVVLHDIDHRRRTEEALRDAHRFLDSIIEQVPTMIFVKDARELRFERFNRAGELLLGLSRDVMIGKNDHDFFPREQADSFAARDRQTLAGREVVDIAEEPIDVASGRRWLHTRQVPILDDAGEPRHLLGISLDITDRKAADDALRRAHEDLELRVRERTADLERASAELRSSEEQLRQAQKMEAVGRLAGGVAHDFNNMLTAILTYARLLKRGSTDPEASGYLDEIVLAGERAAALTNRLLAFSRQQVVQPTLVDLGAIARAMENLLLPLLGERVILRITAAADLPPVLADAGQLEQVLLNLAVNGRDAMPDGGDLTVDVGVVVLVEPLAAAHSQLRPGTYVRLTVTDRGGGMTPETRSRLFEPFFTTKPRGEGTGLGLSTVLGIVHQSGGDIVVTSELGRGSSFVVYLPRVRGDLTPVPVPPAVASTAERGIGTVLLVEDEDLVRRAVGAILLRAGYRVLAATNASDALDLCATHSDIHLVLTDVVMPGMSGRELAAQLTKLLPSAKVILMSGYTDDSVIQHGLLDSGLAFLAKPFSPEELIAKLRQVLAQR